MSNPSGLVVTTPSDLEILMTRSFDAPRALVWRAVTEPELVRRWMFVPPGWEWSECEMDVRVGGQFRWVWNGPDGQRALAIWGEHLEVSPPTRLVHTERMEMGPGACADVSCEGVEPWELLATTELTERGGRTLLRMTLSFPTKEARDGALASGMEQGVAAGYDTLDRMLASESHGAEGAGL